MSETTRMRSLRSSQEWVGLTGPIGGE
jgi:hypothetical protein